MGILTRSNSNQSLRVCGVPPFTLVTLVKRGFIKVRSAFNAAFAMRTFVQIACMNCHSKKSLKSSRFKVNSRMQFNKTNKFKTLIQFNRLKIMLTFLAKLPLTYQGRKNTS